MKKRNSFKKRCLECTKTIITIFITSFLLFVIYIYFYFPQNEINFNLNSPCENVHKKFKRPILIAHRGSRSIAPENTLFAFETSLSLGADMLEFDIQLTKDDDLVLFHDNSLERTTNGTGNVHDHTVQELKQLNAAYHFAVKGQDGTEEEYFPLLNSKITIPTLDEYFQKFIGIPFTIEIKNDELKAAIKMLEIFEKNRKILLQQKNESLADLVVISSSHCSLLEYVRKNTDYCTGACEREATLFSALSLLKLYRWWYSFIDYPTDGVLQLPTFHQGAALDSKEFIQNAHYFNQKIHYWVVNDPEHMRKIYLNGADGIFTDRVDLAAQILRELNYSIEPKRPPNSNETGPISALYYMPSRLYIEPHVCLTLTCHVLSLLLGDFATTLYLVIVLSIIGLWKCRPKLVIVDKNN